MAAASKSLISLAPSAVAASAGAGPPHAALHHQPHHRPMRCRGPTVRHPRSPPLATSRHLSSSLVTPTTARRRCRGPTASPLVTSRHLSSSLVTPHHRPPKGPRSDRVTRRHIARRVTRRRRRRRGASALSGPERRRMERTERTPPRGGVTAAASSADHRAAPVPFVGVRSAKPPSRRPRATSTTTTHQRCGCCCVCAGVRARGPSTVAAAPSLVTARHRSSPASPRTVAARRHTHNARAVSRGPNNER